MSTATSLTRAQLATWRNALFAVFALCGIGMAGWTSRIPAVSAGLDLNTAETGILLFGMAVGSIAGLLASGHLVARLGSITVIRFALIGLPLGITVAAIGVSSFSSFAITFGGLVVFGASMGTCDVAMNVSGAANERVIGRTLMPIYHAFFSIGTMAGAGLGGLAELNDISLGAHIGAVGVAILIAGQFAVRALRPEDRTSLSAPEQPDAGWRERLSIWVDPRTLLIGLIVLGMAFAEGSANDWVAYAMVEGHGTDAATGSFVLGVFLTAMTVGRLAGVKLLDRFGRVPVLRGCAAVAVAGLLLLIFVPVAWIAVVGVALWGLGASLGFPVGMSAAADDPRMAAARVSAVATIGYLAFLVGPPFIGFLGERFGILNGLIAVLALVAAAGLVSRAAAPVAARTPAGEG